MTGISRYNAAAAVGRMFGTEPYSISSYRSWCVKDPDGKVWKFSYDSSIRCQYKSHGRCLNADSNYAAEMVSPKLEYSEMGKLQEVVRCVKNAGAFVNSSCGMHVHVDAANHTPRSLKNALTIMYCKEDILFKALNVQTKGKMSIVRKSVLWYWKRSAGCPTAPSQWKNSKGHGMREMTEAPSITTGQGITH